MSPQTKSEVRGVIYRFLSVFITGGQVQQYNDVSGEAVQYFPGHCGPSSQECDLDKY